MVLWTLVSQLYLLCPRTGINTLVQCHVEPVDQRVCWREKVKGCASEVSLSMDQEGYTTFKWQNDSAASRVAQLGC